MACSVTNHRPIYETAETLANEQDVIESVSRRWGCTAFKLGRDWRADYLLTRNGVGVAVVEVKCRTNPMLQYATYAISARKIESMLSQAHHLDLNAFLIVRWTDAVGWHQIQPGYQIRVGGRRDRGDQADVEPMCHIPVRRFNVVV